MKIKIINQELQDNIVLELEEETIVVEEITKRGWKSEDCYSEIIEKLKSDK